MNDPRLALAHTACVFYERGWMWGTAGNLSHRADANSFWITASGRPKGKLETSDFVRVQLGGVVVDPGRKGQRSSAETCIHDAIYRSTDAASILHVHTVASNLVSRLAQPEGLRLPPLEMIKGFGIADEQPEVHLPVLPNHVDVPRIAADLERGLGAWVLPAVLIADHGITTWGPSLQIAENRLELCEFLFRYMIDARASGIA